MLINVELTFIAFAPKTPDNLSLMHNPASAWSEQINKSDTFFIFIINGENSALKKRQILQKLGYAETITIGNGFNDNEILKNAAIGIVIMGLENSL